MHKYISIINYQLQCKCTNALIYAYKLTACVAQWLRRQAHKQ